MDQFRKILISLFWNGINLLYFSIAVVVDNDSDGGDEVEGGEVPRFEFIVTHDAKLKELLHKISSLEIKLC